MKLEPVRARITRLDAEGEPDGFSSEVTILSVSVAPDGIADECVLVPIRSEPLRVTLDMQCIDWETLALLVADADPLARY